MYKTRVDGEGSVMAACLWHYGSGDAGRLGTHENYLAECRRPNASEIQLLGMHSKLRVYAHEETCIDLYSLQKLPDKSKQELPEIEKRNQLIFERLKETSRSREPFWKTHK